MRNRIKQLFNSRAIHPKFMGAVALIGLTAIGGSYMAGDGQFLPVSAEPEISETAKQSNLSSARSHALTVFGDPKYDKDFKHFEYVNPDAPKGGELSTKGISSSFDSLNDFIFKGQAADGTYLIYDSLMEQSGDEAATAYGLLAESVEIAPDKTWIIFHIRPEARWHDGTPVTAEDVVWTYNTLIEKGKPQYKSSMQEVEKVEALGPKTVKFTFENGLNKTLPLTVGQLPILPKHYWEGVDVDFENSSNVQPMGSGPYRISSYSYGRQIIYERDKDYWGKDLPVNRGRHNFDRIRFEYFKDETAALQAFGTGLLNFRLENQATRWATAYEGLNAITEGRAIKEEIKHDNPAVFQAFYFNTRREKFQDPRVREALALVFNFEWSNKSLAASAYKRIDNIFENSELGSSGLPTGKELEILEEYRGKIPDKVFTEPFRVPKYEGHYKADDGDPSTMSMREGMLKAVNLLKEAGYEYRNGKLVNGKTGEPLTFEFMVLSSGITRWIMPYAANLERMGIETNIRQIDSAQYVNRMNSFDYDVFLAVLGQSLTPGPEQRNYWNSESAELPGSKNFAGVKDPVVDALIERLINAEDKEEMVATARALDRVLLHGHYVVPHLYIDKYRVARYQELQRPDKGVTPRYSLGNFDYWWYEKPGEQKKDEKAVKTPEQKGPAP